MTYDEFLRRVQDQAGLSSPQQTRKAVSATLETLRACVADGGVEALPLEVRQLVGQGLIGGTAAGAGANPQFAGQERAESGGESTPESGQ